MNEIGLPTIDCMSFDWQSFSTLVTGGLAVAAATLVGLRQSTIAQRQADITEKQSEILGRQVDLQEASLRADLFERRLLAFEGSSEFLLSLLQSEPDDDIFAQRMAKFGQIMRESQFLFSNPDVHKRLREIFNRANEIYMDRLTAKAHRELGESLPPNLITRLVEVGSWAMSTLDEMPSVFTKDLAIISRG